jgi:hypothetical protein
VLPLADWEAVLVGCSDAEDRPEGSLLCGRLVLLARSSYCIDVEAPYYITAFLRF